RQQHPRVLLRLLHAERDFFLVRIDLEDNCFDRLADRHQLRWMTYVARPAHLTDVNESLDSRLELDEGAVVGDRDHLSADARTDGILLGDVLPRIALELFQS